VSIDSEAGVSLGDLLHELAQLEAQALGYVKHGQASWCSDAVMMGRTDVFTERKA
jgi:hypothetical protein